jgi:hypothetical protein
MVRVRASESMATLIVHAPESSEFATISVTIVSSAGPG